MRRRRAALITCLLLTALIGGTGLWLRAQQRQYALNRQLIAALVNDDSKQAFALVESGADPNTRYEPAQAPSLHELVKQWLHPSHPPVNDSPTAFMIACGTMWDDGYFTYYAQQNRREHVPLLLVMLTHGADVKALAAQSETPLTGALYTRHSDAAKVLMAYGADVNAKNRDGRTPLMVAALKEDEPAVRPLLERGAKIDAQDKNGWTALFYAIERRRNDEIVGQLLAHGADPNVVGHDRETPLSLAKFFRTINIIAMLKQAGARK